MLDEIFEKNWVKAGIVSAFITAVIFIGCHLMTVKGPEWFPGYISSGLSIGGGIFLGTALTAISEDRKHYFIIVTAWGVTGIGVFVNGLLGMTWIANPSVFYTVRLFNTLAILAVGVSAAVGYRLFVLSAEVAKNGF